MADPASPLLRYCLPKTIQRAAFEFIERVLPVNAVDPRVVDELMVLGARAAADLVQQASDERDQAAVRRHREALTRLVKTRATLPGIAFQPSGPEDTVQVARAALFAAEAGRAEGVEDQIEPLAGGGGGVRRRPVSAGNSRSRRGGSPPRWSSRAPRAPRRPSCCAASTTTPSEQGAAPLKATRRGTRRERSHLTGFATRLPPPTPCPPPSPG